MILAFSSIPPFHFCDCDCGAGVFSGEIIRPASGDMLQRIQQLRSGGDQSGVCFVLDLLVF